MKTEANDSAFGFDGPLYSSLGNGLTKREYFAAMAPTNHDNSVDWYETLSTIPFPKDGTKTDKYKWWIKVQAIEKVMMADALIEALNKEGGAH